MLARFGRLTFRGICLHLTPMWLVPFLLVCALPVQGDLKLTLDQSVYPADDSGTVLEVSYEIPRTSLTFVREDSGFVARYRIGVQISDKRRNVVAGDFWQKVVRLQEYGPTMARDSIEVGTVSLVLPEAGLDARVEVNDEANERSALARFRIDRPTGGLTIRLYKSGKPVSMRKYGIGDTLVAVVEARGELRVTGYELREVGDGSFDSCRFVLKHDRRVVTGATIQTTMKDEGGRMKPEARFEYPIGDSTGVARLGGGEYLLEVAGLGAGRPLSASVRFRVEVPFFLDDSAYLRRVEQLIYLASAEESKHLRSVPRGEREQSWREFWKKKDQSPTTERNESEDQYFERIDYAEEHFGHGDRGYRSDRGHVYVRYGAPDQVDARPFEIDSPAVEVWYYYEVNKRFEFVDRFGAGEYVLQNREALVE
jgi:GWxTD domain-containing protein